MKKLTNKKNLVLALTIFLAVAFLPVANGDGYVFAKTKTPKKVTGVKVKIEKSGTKATIKWNKIKAKGYQIVVKQNGTKKQWTFINKGKKNTKRTVKIKKGVGYTVNVRAYNKKGKKGKKVKYGKWSKTTGFKSPAPTPTSRPSNNPPAAPADVDTYDIGADYVSVRWKTSKNADGYQASLTRTDNGKTQTYKIVTGNSIKITKLYSEMQYEIKIRAYNKKGNSRWSEIIVFTTLSKPLIVEPTIDDPSPSTNKLFQEDTTTYVTYKGIKIHIGQTWTSDLNNQLKAKSSGTWSCTRKLAICDEVNHNRHDEKVYLYNTNDYDPYLEVCVCENQVIKIGSNGRTLGVRKGKTLQRGGTDFNTDANSTVVPNPDVFSEWGASIIWLNSNNYGGTTDNTYVKQSDERTIAFHTINATRVGSGKSILKRSSYLEGVDLTTGSDKKWSGTIPEGYAGEGTVYVNQRYGAQAWAETMDINDKCSHDPADMSNGPCKKGTYCDSIQYLASKEEIGRPIERKGENCATGSLGEGAVTSYRGSPVHWNTLMKNFKSVGTGFYGSYHCEQFSTREAE